MQVTTIGLDIAKNVFQVHGIDAAERVVVRKQLRRSQVLEFFKALPPCLVGIEACATAHYWARELTKLGHQVRLMPAQDVKAYVKRNKSDAADAEAICEAVRRPTMRFVQVKSTEQQGRLMLHRTRDLLMRQRTQLINALRAHMAELGIVAAQGYAALKELLKVIAGERDARLPVDAHASLVVLAAGLHAVQTMIGSIDKRIIVEHRSNEASKRLRSIPGAYAVHLVHTTCCLAGSASYLDDVRVDLHRRRAIRDHDTPVLFDWLIKILSFQGIADAVASGYMAQHGTVRWSDIAEALSRTPSCPKLGGYWRFYDCQYHKGAGTCSEPGHIDACPLPRHPLRNGRLNQMAYSLFLFMRDVADDDFVSWIDRQLDAVDSHGPDRLGALREAIIGPLRNVYGVADKVLAMAMSYLLLSAGKRRPLWLEVGATFVAVDTLVHNFLHRTGILQRLSADHPYGNGCYQPGGCASIIGVLAAHIDARQFNPAFPATFPRFVQSAIWGYCAGNGLEVCNGNRIDDNARCDNVHCQLFRRCDRVALRTEREKAS